MAGEGEGVPRAEEGVPRGQGVAEAGGQAGATGLGGS